MGFQDKKREKDSSRNEQILIPDGAQCKNFFAPRLSDTRMRKPDAPAADAALMDPTRPFDSPRSRLPTAAAIVVNSLT
jgi:hypothetical protein